MKTSILCGYFLRPVGLVATLLLATPGEAAESAVAPEAAVGEARIPAEGGGAKTPPAADSAPGTEVFPLRNIKPAALLEAITPVLEQVKGRATIDQRTQSLLVSAPRGNMLGLRRLVEQIDEVAGRRDNFFIVSVLGAVTSQGSVQMNLDEHPIVLDAIARAGGFTAQADQKSVRLIRLTAEGGRIETILTAEILQKGTSPELALRRGDIIFVGDQSASAPVPERAIFVTGAVNTPGRILMTGDTMPLTELIVRAGGLSRVGNGKSVRVTHLDPATGNKSTTSVDVLALMSGSSQLGPRAAGVNLVAGDLVYVPERAF